MYHKKQANVNLEWMYKKVYEDKHKYKMLFPWSFHLIPQNNKETNKDEM